MAQAKYNGLVFAIFHGKRNIGQYELRDPYRSGDSGEQARRPAPDYHRRGDHRCGLLFLGWRSGGRWIYKPARQCCRRSGGRVWHLSRPRRRSANGRQHFEGTRHPGQRGQQAELGFRRSSEHPGPGEPGSAWVWADDRRRRGN